MGSLDRRASGCINRSRAAIVPLSAMEAEMDTIACGGILRLGSRGYARGEARSWKHRRSRRRIPFLMLQMAALSRVWEGTLGDLWESRMQRVRAGFIAIPLLLAYSPIDDALAARGDWGCGSRSHPSTHSSRSHHRNLPHHYTGGDDGLTGTYHSQVSHSKSEWQQARRRPN